MTSLVPMPGVKMGVEDYVFWSEIGSGFAGPRAAQSHQEFP